MILSTHFSPATATDPISTATGAGAMTGAGAKAAGKGATPGDIRRIEYNSVESKKVFLE